MKILKTKSFRQEHELLAYANEQVLIKPYAVIVNVGIHFNNYGADAYSLWWTETTSDGNL